MFTHNDLSMCDILLDDDGQVWVVDWNEAGFYPRWFEHLGMQMSATRRLVDSWGMTQFMGELAFGMKEWMKRIGISNRCVGDGWEWR